MVIHFYIKVVQLFYDFAYVTFWAHTMKQMPYEIPTVRLFVKRFSWNHLQEFSNFLHEVRVLFTLKSGQARFFEKNPGPQFLGQKGPEWTQNEVF